MSSWLALAPQLQSAVPAAWGPGGQQTSLTSRSSWAAPAPCPIKCPVCTVLGASLHGRTRQSDYRPPAGPLAHIPWALNPLGAQTQPSICRHSPAGMRSFIGAAGMSKLPGMAAAQTRAACSAGHAARLVRERVVPGALNTAGLLARVVAACAQAHSPTRGAPAAGRGGLPQGLRCVGRRGGRVDRSGGQHSPHRRMQAHKRQGPSPAAPLLKAGGRATPCLRLARVALAGQGPDSTGAKHRLM